jgi:RimJ/RimL family protein N-acetyltransferase
MSQSRSRVAVSFDFQPTLTGGLLLVQPLVRSDFDALHGVASDPRIWEQHPAHDRWRLEVFSALFERLLVSGGGLVVRERATGAVIGSSSFYEYNEAARDIVVGYTFLARRCWGGLFNRELKALMLEHAFKFVDRVWFHVAVTNFRSQRAMENVGATLSHHVVRESGGVTAEFIHYYIDRPSTMKPKPAERAESSVAKQR